MSGPQPATRRGELLSLAASMFAERGLRATTVRDIADAAGIPVIPHAGMNTTYGQHFNLMAGNAPMGEFFIGSPPGVQLESVAPERPVPRTGRLLPASDPGFGPWPDLGNDF